MTFLFGAVASAVIGTIVAQLLPGHGEDQTAVRHDERMQVLRQISSRLERIESTVIKTPSPSSSQRYVQPDNEKLLPSGGALPEPAARNDPDLSKIKIEHDRLTPYRKAFLSIGKQLYKTRFFLSGLDSSEIDRNDVTTVKWDYGVGKAWKKPDQSLHLNRINTDFMVTATLIFATTSKLNSAADSVYTIKVNVSPN